MTEPKYIDAEKFVDKYGDWYTEEGTESGFIGTIKYLVKQMPAADVIEVVRCKNCRSCITGMDGDHPYYQCGNFNITYGLLGVDPNHYCSYGERKDG